MPKLISIKRPFAKKTANIKNEAVKSIAELAKDAESSCTELAKDASKFKKLLKSSDAKKLDHLNEKIMTLKDKGKKPDPKDVKLLKTLFKSFESKLSLVFNDAKRIMSDSTFFTLASDGGIIVDLKQGLGGLYEDEDEDQD